MTQQTFALPAATVRTIVRHVLRDYSYERHLLRISVVVVQRKEPMARFHVVRHFLLDRWLDERNQQLILTTPTYFLPNLFVALRVEDEGKKKKNKEKRKEKKIQSSINRSIKDFIAPLIAIKKVRK